MGWILRLVLIWLVIRAILRLAQGIMTGLREAASPPPAVPLVRDPVCGTFVVAATAPSFGTGARMRFFCSDACRRTYEAKASEPRERATRAEWAAERVPASERLRGTGGAQPPGKQ